MPTVKAPISPVRPAFLKSVAPNSNATNIVARSSSSSEVSILSKDNLTNGISIGKKKRYKVDTFQLFSLVYIKSASANMSWKTNITSASLP